MVLLYSILMLLITILMGFKWEFNFPKYRINLHYNRNVYLFIHLFIYLFIHLITYFLFLIWFIVIFTCFELRFRFVYVGEGS